LELGKRYPGTARYQDAFPNFLRPQMWHTSEEMVNEQFVSSPINFGAFDVFVSHCRAQIYFFCDTTILIELRMLSAFCGGAFDSIYYMHDLQFIEDHAQFSSLLGSALKKNVNRAHNRIFQREDLL